MKSTFNRSVFALTAIVLAAGASQAYAQQKPLHSYQSGTKEFWTHPPDDWFLGDETEAQRASRRHPVRRPEHRKPNSQP